MKLQPILKSAGEMRRKKEQSMQQDVLTELPEVTGSSGTERRERGLLVNLAVRAVRLY